MSQAQAEWTIERATSLMALPLNDLLFEAQTVHRQHFDANAVQISQLCSIKTGGCPEDCGYCSQSARFESPLKASKLMDTQSVLDAAKAAKASGASRFCMGAAWRSPKERDMPALTQMIAEVKAMGLETCATLGMLDEDKATRLKEAGLDYYNHNIDTSEEFYGEIITTRTFQDRLDTLDHVRAAGMSVCSGGILGMGERREDRASMLCTLANLPTPPESVPINMLMPQEGTPMAHFTPLDEIEFVRTVAAARIMMPKSMVRLSAGRESMSESTQALCFMAGANSIFYGEKLLTAGNPDTSKDDALFQTLGLHPMELTAQSRNAKAA
jgi:biotin synthase